MDVSECGLLESDYAAIIFKNVYEFKENWSLVDWSVFLPVLLLNSVLKICKYRNCLRPRLHEIPSTKISVFMITDLRQTDISST